MSLTMEEARDEAFTMFMREWNAKAGAVVGGPTPLVLFQGKEVTATPPATEAFARITMLHNTGGQASLSGADAKRRWNRSGIIIVQCFGPTSSGRGLAIAERLAIIALGAYEGQASPGGMWFRNCRPNEIGPDKSWYQFNVVAEFSYDQVR